jgi:hypothetical protein
VIPKNTEFPGGLENVINANHMPVIKKISKRKTENDLNISRI